MKPEQLAREIVSEHMTIGEIEWLIRQHSTSDPRREKLLAAVCPRYPEVREALSRCLGYCKNLVEFDDDIEDLHRQEVNAYASAGFALGFVAAMQLKGN